MLHVASAILSHRRQSMPHILAQHRCTLNGGYWIAMNANTLRHNFFFCSLREFSCSLSLLLATVAAGANDCNNANRLQSLVEHFRFHSIWLYALHPKWNPTPQPKHIFFDVFFAFWFGAYFATVLFIGRCVPAFSQYYFQMHASKSLIWFDSVRRGVVQSLDAFRFFFFLRFVQCFYARRAQRVLFSSGKK